MNEAIDKMQTERAMREAAAFKTPLHHDQKQARQRLKKSVSISQSILFHKDNPFIGFDGFVHLLNKQMQVKMISTS